MKNLFRLFYKPSPETIARIELEEARRQLLVSESASEYAALLVLYHKGRIARLEQRLALLGRGTAP